MSTQLHSTESSFVEITTDPATRAALGDLAADLANEYDHPENPDFLRDAPDLDLPAELEEPLERMRSNVTDVVHLKKLFEIDQEMVGPTPADRLWYPNGTRSYQLGAVAVSSRLGSPRRWRDRASGKVVQLIVPVEKDSDRQVGSSSEVGLSAHTEEAFKRDRPYFLALFGIRNEEQTATTIVLLDDILEALRESTREVLGQPRFRVRPDESYRDREASRIVTPISSENGRLDLRIDMADMFPIDGDKDAKLAWSELSKAIHSIKRSVIVGAGDLVLINNRTVAHGRAPFKPSVNGSERRFLLQILLGRNTGRIA